MKKILKTIIADIDYFLHRWKIRKGAIEVYSIDETISELIHTEKSLVRFGDGEIAMIRGRDLVLQKVTPEIIDGLRRIIRFENEDLLVAIPDIFNDLSIYRKENRYFWKDHLLFSRKVYLQTCSRKKYYNAYISRFYYAFDDKSRCGEWIEGIKQIWKDKDIVIVEGTRTHNGVGNDLFAGAKSVERIIGPSSDAYEKLDEIIEVCRSYSKDRMFLISLGIAAKFLTERLFLEGYRVLDIGNLDMEYEWYLQKADKKVPVEKHEIIGEKANIDAGYTLYLNQIKGKVN